MMHSRWIRGLCTAVTIVVLAIAGSAALLAQNPDLDVDTWSDGPCTGRVFDIHLEGTGNTGPWKVYVVRMATGQIVFQREFSGHFWDGPIERGVRIGSDVSSTWLPGEYRIEAIDHHGDITEMDYFTVDPVLGAGSVGIVTQNTGCGGDHGSATVVIDGPEPGAAPYTYEWSPNVSSGASATNLAAGTYAVTITDENGCVVTKSCTIAPGLTVGGTMTLDQDCGTATYQIQASGGSAPYSARWPDGGSGLMRAGLIAGTYTVVVTDANGCEGTATVVIPAMTGTPISLTATIAQEISCDGSVGGSIETSISNGTGPYSYQWTRNGTPISGSGPDMNDLSPGSYTITVTDSRGCRRSTGIVLTAPADDAPLNASLTWRPTYLPTHPQCWVTVWARVTGGRPPYTYDWGNGPTTWSATWSGQTPGEFEVIVTDARGCQVVRRIVFNDCKQNLIGHMHDINEMTITPNPSLGELVLRCELQAERDVDVIVIDRMGDEVYSESLGTLAPDTYEIPIDLTTQPAGPYYVTIMLDGNVAATQMVEIQ